MTLHAVHTTHTALYTVLHTAFAYAAPEGATGFDVRLLYAVHEGGGAVATDELEAALAVEGSAIRRSCGVLYRLGLAEGAALSRRGRVIIGGPRRGCRTRLTLTPAGRAIAESIDRDVAEQLGVSAVAA